MNIPKITYSVFLIFLFILFYSCEEKITGNYEANRPPDTFIFVESLGEDTLNYLQSIQVIHWDGRDPDGFVRGFYYTWMNNPTDDDWIWTTERSDIFPLEIFGNDTIYQFQVMAVDNLDLNDPTPALQNFPIINSPPHMEWTINSTIPETTFTVASFSWQASDPDGDLTIEKFEYAIDAPDNWNSISGLKRNLTINADSGLTGGDHILYMRAVDIAGATSEIIRMPQGSSWHVKEPKGRYLLIDDYDADAGQDALYNSIMAAILPEIGESEGYDYWNIEELFPVSRTQFTETLKLYDRILWYADPIRETDEHFIAAQIAIPEFRKYGGKIIYTVKFSKSFGALGNPLEFSPVDSLGKSYNFTTSVSFKMDPLFQEQFGFVLPDLKFSVTTKNIIALKPKATSIPMYMYDNQSEAENPKFVLVGQNDNSKEYDFVFVGSPLHIVNGNNNIDEFIKIVFRDLF